MNWKKEPFIIAFALIVCTCVTACNDMTQDVIENKIAKSKELSQVDKLCKELPRPSGFEFGYKKIAGNSDTVSIDYQYKTTLSFAEIRDFYFDYFKEAGWTLEMVWDENETSHKGQFRFRNGSFTIWLEHVPFENANYSIGCTVDV